MFVLDIPHSVNTDRVRFRFLKKNRTGAELFNAQYQCVCVLVIQFQNICSYLGTWALDLERKFGVQQLFLSRSLIWTENNIKES